MKKPEFTTKPHSAENDEELMKELQNVKYLRPDDKLEIRISEFIMSPNRWICKIPYVNMGLAYVDTPNYLKKQLNACGNLQSAAEMAFYIKDNLMDLPVIMQPGFRLKFELKEFSEVAFYVLRGD